jgi:hypothetical protein
MTSLNQSLFQALRQFGEVRITSPGARLEATYQEMPDGRVRMQVISAGEYLRINCPYCNDTRFRLWINHRWGLKDPHTGTRNRWLAICYNEDCLAAEANRQDLISRTSWYHREAGAGRVKIAVGRAEPVGRPIPLPGDYVPLDELKRGHHARRYLRDRGYNPDTLARDWSIGFSREACCLSRRAGRLLIPLYRIEKGKPVCWGWQARAIDPDDEQRAKYFTAPGLKKSQLLYGLERVDAGTGPILICEGATDVWRAGKNAVALLGKNASTEQVCLIRKHFRGRPLAVALDPDARDTARMLVRGLRQARLKSVLHPDETPVVLVRLPDGQDPGDCTREQLWGLAEDTLRHADGG